LIIDLDLITFYEYELFVSTSVFIASFISVLFTSTQVNFRKHDLKAFRFHGVFWLWPGTNVFDTFGTS